MRASGRWGVWLAAGIAAMLVGAGLASAGERESFTSFAGSCSLQGNVAFSPPLTATQQALQVSYDSTGTCSGTLNGRSISNAPVRLRHAGHSDGSCIHASTAAPGRGAIFFANGTIVPYTFEFSFVTTEGTFTLHGERSGSASGHGSFLTQRTAPTDALKCGGSGLSNPPMDMSLSTDSPLVSERHGR